MHTHPEEWATTRDWIAEHFDGKADAWEALTSDRPLGRIRESVRRGRRTMQETILSWLPPSLEGRTVLDAGCGPGTLALAMAARGARVTGIDISRPLVEVARQRAAAANLRGSVDFQVGDMLAAQSSAFDYVVAMDSLLHYRETQLMDAVRGFSDATRYSVVFTFAPRTPLLAAMHAVGQALPRSNRSPSIEPMSADRLRDGLTRTLDEAWSLGNTRRVRSGFYISQALELGRAA